MSAVTDQALSRHLAALLARLADRHAEMVADATARLVDAALIGHTAVDLDGLARGGDGASLRAGLLESGVCGAPGERRPLVVDEAGRLYLYRYWHYERQVANALLARAQVVRKGADDALIAARLAELFPRAEERDQKTAAAVAALRGLAVISGGPGTGKTTAVARLLALLRELDPDARIALAAPTGKAAARVGESIRHALEKLPSREVAASLPTEAATLHRLLGYLPAAGRYRHGADNPLPHDVVIVDEASMIGLAQMARLLAALRDDAHLVLLGDRDQLASVEPGSVFGDICAGARGFSAPFVTRLRSLGIPAEARQAASRLQDCVVTLRHSYRFAPDSDVGRLAAAVRGGDVAAVLAVIREARAVTLHEAGERADRLGERIVRALRPYFAALRHDAPLEETAAHFDAFRLLAAFRRGSAGVAGLNAAAEAALAGAGLIDADRPWYRGRPIMVTRNDYQLGLFNGAVGFTTGSSEEPLVAFATADGWRKLAPARLPEHETVYAMTVHKSQGSEFDTVAIVLPEESDKAGRETIYTAITRARRRVEIYGSPEVLGAAIGRRELRSSGLRDALAGPRPAAAPQQGELF